MVLGLGPDLGAALVAHVRQAMVSRLRGVAVETAHPRLSAFRSGLFITVEALVRSGGYERREVRGSLGILEPHRDLAYDSAKVAARLASSIPRFTELDMRRSVVEVTLVGPLAESPSLDLEWGVEGICAVAGDRRLVVLPQTMLERRLFGPTLARYVESMLGPPERVFRFRTEIYYELRPEGPVIARELWRNRLIRQLGL